MPFTGITLALCVALTWVILQTTWAQPPTLPEARLSPALREALVKSLDQGLAYVRKEQLPNHSWQNHPGLTAVVATSMLRYPGGVPAADRERVEQALQYVAGFAKADGGIYQRDVPNYNTAVAVVALADSGNPEYAPTIEKARDFLLLHQVDEGEGYDPGHKFYGGIGYGADLRPDLANLEYGMQALHAAKLPAEHAAWKKAITFLQRIQNRSESNDQAWAGNDGGFVYYPGFSYADKTNSYASMTLAGLLSFYYADVKKDDPRVQAALDWFRKHYSVDDNPGLNNKMLYYYYMNFAKAMAIYHEPVIVDSQGVQRNWREELGQKLLSLQYPEGYWVSDDSEWWMDNKVLVTAFTIVALEYILQ